MNLDVRPFWDFMIERESIRLRRLEGKPMTQWTDDPIFKEFSFTNVKREHDRTTVELCRDFYHKVDLFHPSPEALLNASLFRYFGTAEMARAIGWKKHWDEDDRASVILTAVNRMILNQRVFTAAYIVPNCGSSEPKHCVVVDIVSMIWKYADSILDTNSWATACERLCAHWGVGSFMAKEILLDYIIATKHRFDDWETWTPVGPGGRRGAGIVKYGIIKGIPEYEALIVIRDIYDDRSFHWPTSFVELELTDIQFQLCEYAKYMKAKTKQGRPKRKFKPTIDQITRIENG